MIIHIEFSREETLEAIRAFGHVASILCSKRVGIEKLTQNEYNLLHEYFERVIFDDCNVLVRCIDGNEINLSDASQKDEKDIHSSYVVTNTTI